MREFLGNLIIVLSFILGAYLCLYVGLYGGAMQIINALNPLEAKEIVIGAIRILCANMGWLVFYIGFYIGDSIKF